MMVKLLYRCGTDMCRGVRRAQQRAIRNRDRTTQC